MRKIWDNLMYEMVMKENINIRSFKKISVHVYIAGR